MDDEGFWFPTPPHLKRRRRSHKSPPQAQPRLCREAECTNEARSVTGARFCEQHARVIDYRVTETKPPQVHAPVFVQCRNCPRTFRFRKYVVTEQANAWRSFCSQCRGATLLRWAPIYGHRVPPVLIIQWVSQGRALACDSCHRPFTPHREPQIDHAHAHCAGTHGCGECVRGVVCGECNVAVAFIELMRRRGIEADAIAYLDRVSVPITSVASVEPRKLDADAPR